MSAKAASALLALLAIFTAPLHAADGFLDTTFWSDGKISLGASGSNLMSRRLVAAPDDRMVFAFTSSAEPGDVSWRAIGDGGFLIPAPCVTTLGGMQVGSIEGLAFDPQGRLVVGATVRLTAPGSDYVSLVLRFDYPDCALDASFGGGDGKYFFSWDNYDEIRLRGLAVRPDSSIVVAAGGRSGSNYDFLVYSVTPTGTPDFQFSADSRSAWQTSYSAEPHAIAIAPSGDILVVGTLGTANINCGLVQWSGAGVYRTAMDIFVDLSSGGADHCYAAAFLPDGRLAIGGAATVQDALEDRAIVLLRRPNGDGIYVPDPTFDGDGERALDFGGAFSQIESIATQSDGKIVVAGWTESPDDAKMIAARLLPNGQLDSTFGIFGIRPVDFDLGGSLHDRAFAVALQAGRVVLGGTAVTAAGNVGAALARLQNALIFSSDFETGSAELW